MKALPRRQRFNLLSGAMALVLGFCSSPAGAQAVVIDPAHITTSLTSQFQALAQYGKQLTGLAKDTAHYKAVYDHYQQQLIKLQRMVTTLSFSGSQPMEKVADDYLVDSVCQSTHGGLNLRSILSGFHPDPKGDIVAQQKLICELTQTTRNMKFNETIDFLTRVKTETQDAVKKIADRQDSGGKTESAVNTSTNDAANVGVQLQGVYQNYTSKLQMYDAQIASLVDMQRTLATGALRGVDRGPIGTLVKTATLQTALKAGH